MSAAGFTPVSDERIDSAWQAVQDAVQSGELDSWMDDFAEKQPAIFEFLSEGAEGLSSDAADLSFHAALVIWSSFGASISVAIEASELIRHYKENLNWLRSHEGEALLLQKKLGDYSKFCEPKLMRYVSEAVFESSEDGLELEPEEQEEVFLILKTIVDSLSLHPGP